jgi:hypothetical protein
MAKLTATARRAIGEAGFTVAEFARINGYADGKWGGDVCGCTDTGRCANGFHHMGENDCGCLPVLLDQAVAWREATRWMNSVELSAPYSLFNWVSVSTPGVLATVSATAGTTWPQNPRPAESVVNIATREGWTAQVGTDKDGRIEIRIVKAALPAKGDGAGKPEAGGD